MPLGVVGRQQVAVRHCRAVLAHAHTALHKAQLGRQHVARDDVAGHRLAAVLDRDGVVVGLAHREVVEQRRRQATRIERLEQRHVVGLVGVVAGVGPAVIAGPGLDVGAGLADVQNGTGEALVEQVALEQEVVGAAAEPDLVVVVGLHLHAQPQVGDLHVVTGFQVGLAARPDGALARVATGVGGQEHSARSRAAHGVLHVAGEGAFAAHIRRSGLRLLGVGHRVESVAALLGVDPVVLERAHTAAQPLLAGNRGAGFLAKVSVALVVQVAHIDKEHLELGQRRAAVVGGRHHELDRGTLGERAGGVGRETHHALIVTVGDRLGGQRLGGHLAAHTADVSADDGDALVVHLHVHGGPGHRRARGVFHEQGDERCLLGLRGVEHHVLVDVFFLFARQVLQVAVGHGVLGGEAQRRHLGLRRRRSLVLQQHGLGLVRVAVERHALRAVAGRVALKGGGLDGVGSGWKLLAQGLQVTGRAAEGLRATAVENGHRRGGLAVYRRHALQVNRDGSAALDLPGHRRNAGQGGDGSRSDGRSSASGSGHTPARRHRRGRDVLSAGAERQDTGNSEHRQSAVLVVHRCSPCGYLLPSCCLKFRGCLPPR